MIVPDLNLLLYATFTRFSHHAAARAWWDRALTGAEPVALVAPVVFGYVRLTTNRRIFDAPLPVAVAVADIEAWLGASHVLFLPDSERQLQIALDLLRDLGAASTLTTDAQIAAHALAVGGTVYSHDTDFARFPRVQSVDTLRSG